MMESKMMKMLALMMVAFVAVAGASPVIVNGSFETVDDVDEGPNDKVVGGVGDPFGLAGMVSISGAGGWDVESHWTYANLDGDPIGEIPNCSVDNTIYTAEGDFSGVRTGDKYLRLSQDNGADPGPGGVSQNLGAMVIGEGYRIDATVMTHDNNIYAVLADYTVQMELWSGSIGGTLLASGSRTETSSGITGDINSGILTVASGVATTTDDLILRIFVENDAAGGYRGGVDNVQLTVEYNASNPDPTHNATEVAVDKTFGWLTVLDPNSPTVPDQNVTEHLVYMTSGDPEDPNLYLVATIDSGYPSVSATGSWDPAVDLLTDTDYAWRVDEKYAGGSTVEGIVWSFSTVKILPYFVAPFIADIVVYGGEEAVFSVNVESATAVTYAWKKYVEGGSDQSVGTDSSSLTIDTTGMARDTYYYCEVTNAVDTRTSALGWLKIKSIIGHWTFDDTLDDSSGNANHGIFYGGTPSYVAGILGNAIELDGIDDYVEIPVPIDPNELYDYEVYDNVTYSCWIKSDTIAFAAGYVGKWSFDVNGSFLLNEGGYDGTTLWWGGTAMKETTFVYDGQWHLLVGTYNSSTATQNLFIDGKLRMTDIVGPPAQTPGVPVQIGILETISNFNGVIDDVIIYNYDRTAKEIAERYYSATNIPTCYGNPFGDLNADCVVNLLDFADLAGAWLDCGIYPNCD